MAKVLHIDELEQELFEARASVICHSMDGVILGASPGAAKLLGYSSEEISQLYMAHIRPKKLRLSDVCKSSKEDSAPVIFARRNGSRFPARTASSVIKLAIGREVESVVLLELEVLANALGSSNRPLPDVSIADTAHYLELLGQQVHTPVSGICSLVSDLKSHLSGATELGLLNRLEQLSAELSFIAADIDDAFKAGVAALKLEEQPFNFIEMLDELKQEWKRSAYLGSEFSLAFSVGAAVPELVFGDVKRVKQLLTALVQFAHLGRFGASALLKVDVVTSSHTSALTHLNFTLLPTNKRQLQRGQNALLPYRNALMDHQPLADSLPLAKAHRLIQLMDGELLVCIGAEVPEFRFKLHLPEVHSLDLHGNTDFLMGQRVLLCSDSAELFQEQLLHWGAQVTACDPSQLSAIKAECDELSQQPSLVLFSAAARESLEQSFLGQPVGSDRARFVMLESECEEVQGLDDDRPEWISLVSGSSLLAFGNQLAQLLQQEVPYPYGYCSKQRVMQTNSGRTRLLLVDALDASRIELRDSLEAAGYHVEVAHNGMDAVLATALQSYDLIIIDVDLPQMDGIETVTHIRKNSEVNRLTPIIAVSASQSANLRVSCSQSGVKTLLSRPLNLLGLNQLVESYVGYSDAGDVSGVDTVENPSADLLLDVDCEAAEIGGPQSGASTGFTDADRVKYTDSGGALLGIDCDAQCELDLLYPREGQFRRSAERSHAESNRSDAPVVDDTVLERLIQETGMDVAQEMLNLFLEELDVSLNAVVSAIAASDFRDVYRDLCAIRSTVKTFGFVSLYQVAEQLIKTLDSCGHLSADDSNLLQQTYMRSCLRLSEAA
jgi:CheY-like chemotaxis protein/HPt (histidine-containing phosphotransfer) domain-containing protein